MADITSAIIKINDVEVAQDAPISEAIFKKMGATINGLIDKEVDHEARIGVLEGYASQQELSFGPVSDSINVGPGTNSDTTLGTYTNLRGRPVKIAFNAGEFLVTTSQGAGGTFTTFGVIELVRGSTVIAVLHSGNPSGISAAIAAGQSSRSIDLGYARGYSESPPISPNTTPTLLGRPTVVSCGGSLVVEDNPGPGTFTYKTRATVAGSGAGASISSYTNLAGFIVET